MNPCKRCRGTVFRRMNRQGFFECYVLPFFNLYPWSCAACGKLRYESQRSEAAPEL